MGERREELAQGATDYVLEHGLIGLSLRPLAAALGTSDRMLLYHFSDKDDLVATVLRVATDRSVAGIRAVGSSSDVRQAVLDLWAVVSAPEQARCQRLYVEAAALGVLGTEPYATVVAEANDDWMEALATHLLGSGLTPALTMRAAALVEAAFMGLQLDGPLARPEVVAVSVRDLADAVAALGAG
jgi:AcrR family transcriptional regulator